jgi:membrane-associated protease RseP (regulator of RpoE activity)
MPGDVIISINGSRVRSIADLINAERRLQPGSVVLVSTLRGNVTVVLGSSPKNSSLPWFGIYLNPFPYYRSPWLPSSASMPLEELIIWIVLFSFGIGILNALPLIPLDGGLVLKDSLMLLISDEKSADRIAKAISMAAGFVLVSNIVYSIAQLI